MPLTKTLRRRGANTVVTAYGEVLFGPGGDVGKWAFRLSHRARTNAAHAAPSNKRPRWAHYGRPLKQTMRASTAYRPNEFRIYSAIGSTSEYSAYVDQGTGVYAGGSPYPAKILPPWTRGGASLYESTWAPGGRRVNQVMIKGQKGQFFFDRALQTTFRESRLASMAVEGGSIISNAITSAPSSLTNFMSDNPNAGAFRAQLEEWRTWRDARFNAGYRLGEGSKSPLYARQSRRTINRPASSRRSRGDDGFSEARATRARAQSAERSRRYRERQRRGRPTRNEIRDRNLALRNERAAVLAGAIKRYGASNVDRGSLSYSGGRWVVLVRVKDDRGRNVWVERSVASRV